MTKATELVRAFYAAVARADVPGVVALLHPNLYWTEAEGFPYYSGTWRMCGRSTMASSRASTCTPIRYWFARR
jgi:ketosteroid isomerase-like protein